MNFACGMSKVATSRASRSIARKRHVSQNKRQSCASRADAVWGWSRTELCLPPPDAPEIATNQSALHLQIHRKSDKSGSRFSLEIRHVIILSVDPGHADDSLDSLKFSKSRQFVLSCKLLASRMFLDSRIGLQSRKFMKNIDFGFHTFHACQRVALY